ncbi:MAG: hypothetical protein IKQ40_04820 [Lachnospiraceae bacterium]|nr:hypothetical protein [Lachnospiraceae bacterium]
MNLLNDEKRNKWLCVLLLIAAVIATSWPVLFMEVAKGHDLEVHLMRIEGILSDASWRNLPVRIQSKWLDGYGYPVSVLYGDLFLYVGAIFRKLGFPIITAYRLFVVCINTATITIAYLSFRTYFKNRMISTLSAILYACAAYRLVDEYVRSAVGETLTIVFLPAVAASVCMIFTKEDRAGRIKAAFLLALTLTAVTCSHTLTTSMLAVVLPPVCLAGLFVFCDKGKRLVRITDFVTAAVSFVLMSAFFIVPFLDYYLTVDIAFASDEKMSIQKHGVRLRHLFDFFSDPFKTADGDIQKTPGLILMAVLVCAVIYVIVSLTRKVYFEKHRRIVFELCVSLVIIFMSSHIFPWDFIENNMPLGNILTAIEFPMRYLAFAILLLSLLAGDLIYGFIKSRTGKEDANRILAAICCVVCVLCIFNVVHLCIYNRTFEKKARFMQEEDLGRWEYYAMDFQLKNTTVNDLDPGIKYEGLLDMEVLSRNSNDFLIRIDAGPEYGWVQLPVFNYKYYYACDLEDPSQVFEIHEGANRTVGVLLPGSYSGILHVYWREPALWIMAKIISLITFAGCIIYMVSGSFKKKKQEAAQ